MRSESEVRAHIAMKAAEDDEFRARLVADPRATMGKRSATPVCGSPAIVVGQRRDPVLLVDPVLIETFVEAAPPRPWGATGLLDEMPGSTRGSRDPGGAVEGVAGP